MYRTYFISGHRDVTEEEFKEHYVPQIEKVLWDGKSMFVIGDYHGVDTMAQKFLKECGETDIMKRVVVFHMLETPRNNAGFYTIGGFKDDEARDSAMTDASDIDILWVRPGNEGSGTHQNILRRMNPAGTYVKDITRKPKVKVSHNVVMNQNKYKKKKRK